MNNATFGYELSMHACKRLYERHPGIFADPQQVGKVRWTSAYKVLDDCVEDKSVKNNTRFMVYLHEKYGYEKEFHFFVNGDVLFVGIVEAEGKKLITTCMSCCTHEIPHLRNAGLVREDRFGARQAPARYRKFG
jgi:hypothetical protein